MDDAISNVTPEHALELVTRLNNETGAIRDAVVAEARGVPMEIDQDEIADDSWE